MGFVCPTSELSEAVVDGTEGGAMLEWQQVGRKTLNVERRQGQKEAGNASAKRPPTDPVRSACLLKKTALRPPPEQVRQSVLPFKM